MCAEKKKSVGNTFFEKKNIYKFTCVSERDGRKSQLDFSSVREEDRNRFLHMSILRGALRCMSRCWGVMRMENNV